MTELQTPRNDKDYEKLKTAVAIIADERYCDSSSDAVLWAIEKEFITRDDIYYAVELIGYRWHPHRKKWYVILPEWILTFRALLHANGYKEGE